MESYYAKFVSYTVQQYIQQLFKMIRKFRGMSLQGKSNYYTRGQEKID